MKLRGMNAGRIRINLSLITLAVLLLLMLIIAAAGAVSLFAGYRRNGQTADNARAASWKTSVSDVTLPSDGILRSDGSDTTGDYRFKVSSQSETACSYVIRFSGIPSDVGIAMDGGGFQKADAAGMVTFTDPAWRFAADGVRSRDHSFCFASLNAADGGTDKIDIEVLFTQTD